MPLCTQLVRKLHPSEQVEWMRQIEREQVYETVDGLVEWAQARAKMMRKRDRYDEPKDVEKHTFKKNEGNPNSVFVK